MVRNGRRSYEFLPFRLDPAERRLMRDGEPVALTPKCFDLLVVLVENSGHLLEKAELLTRVWPNQSVEEGNLSFNVSELRRILGEGQNGRQFIETVRTKGFRFVAAVNEITDRATGDDGALPLPVAGPSDAPVAGPSDAPLTVTPTPLATLPGLRRRRLQAVSIALIAATAMLAMLVYFWRRNSVPAAEGRATTIAVLPFKPLTASLRDAPLEIGICNAVITRLAGVEELVVRPTSAVAAYDHMGQDPLAAARALHADAVLEGYLQRSQQRIRVTARLLRTVDGKSLWSGEFNENFTDIFTVEDSISRQIAEALHVHLTGAEERRIAAHSTDNVEAYELYLKGRYFEDKRTPESVAKSIDYFQQATVKDPRYASAFAALANAYVVLAVRADMPPKDSYQNARAAAMHALSLDASTAVAHSALANVKSWYEWDWAGAEREFNRALQLSDNDPVIYGQYATYLTAVGRPQEAIAAARHAQRLAPLSMTLNVQAARIFLLAGDHDTAIRICREALEMDPSFGGAHLILGRAYAQQALYGDALAELERARPLLKNSDEVLALIAYVDAVSGHATEARQILRDLVAHSNEKYVSPYHLAMIHAGLGERDQAFQCLERANDDREGRLTIIKSAPEFSSLRDDPRFAQLLRRMKLQ